MSREVKLSRLETVLDEFEYPCDRAAAVSLALLSRDLDTFVQTRHDRETAERVRADARRVLAGEASVERFADDLVAKGINPGTTADIVAGGLFVALAGGLEV